MRSKNSQAADPNGDHQVPNGSWYNGYSPKERDVKFNELKRLIARGMFPAASGPCMLCNDDRINVEYHCEDYGKPFLWTPPAMLSLCRHCHRDRLHKRFAQPSIWHAYVEHVRRGGYARDLKRPAISLEFRAFRAALQSGTPFTLRPLRPYAQVRDNEWFANLRMDPESRSDRSARPSRFPVWNGILEG